jgi:hypothetical protein
MGGVIPGSGLCHKVIFEQIGAGALGRVSWTPPNA